MKKEEFKNIKKLKLQVITLSDRAHKGEYKDLSGPEIINQVEKFFTSNSWNISTEIKLIPDNPQLLEDILIKSIKDKTDIIITTGGTGIGPKDFTPEVAKKVIEKELPGIMENIRVKFGQINPNALLSRSIAGLTDQSLIYTLPGSVKAVKEYLSEILKTTEHLLYMLHEIDVHKKTQ